MTCALPLPQVGGGRCVIAHAPCPAIRYNVPMAPEPRANPLLVGHAQAEAMLTEAMRAGRMHHAWLITGPDGIGKATLAYRFARRLLAGMTGGEHPGAGPGHPVFRRVAAGPHADLLTVERAYDEKRKRLRTEIAVDDVRRITDFMRLTPAEGGWRVVVVDGAEELNRNAGQRAAEGAGGAAAARGAAAGLRGPRPAAPHDPQPLPPPAPRPAAPGADGPAARDLSARTCPRTNAAGW